ncbi:DUF3427 domain-containing protein [uncultured Lactobacillus sp.]|uniref:DUF3427 domain-containing protein n=1 Tax=uncultured Lactobacillus sp. TaxID=153152 RepID=UPI00258A8A6C|nr:DEAD/DEAH box helicase [uncultured Lactobacillus sp.]
MTVMRDAILNGFEDEKYPGSELLGPRILGNDAQEKIWFTLREELYSCKSFTWAVAFITQDMLVPLKVVLADLANQGVSGTIITGDYLGFNDPRVFEELQKIPNLKIRIATNTGFHAKGYLFEHGDYQTIVVGSANFTRSALLSNYEWALKVSSNKQANLTKQFAKKIALLKQNSFAITSEWLEEYKENWIKPKETVVRKNVEKITPNQMQQAALKNLNALVANGEKRGLVVSATGTGKTYLGAFAVKDFKPKKFLYVVHRQQIAKKSLESFYKVIGSSRKDYGLLSGDHHDVNRKYVFATVQTLSQPDVLASLAEDEFDYILIDEAHRAAAPSYQKILAHFKPEFLLGMTATPERMDEQNVYQIFDYNLAYEIRLRDALEEKMLTPFHYVGVQDYEVAGQTIDETTGLRYLVSEQRVDYVLKEIEYYGYCGDHAKGLVFCSRQDEAKELAILFSKKGHPAVALTNEDSEKRRSEVIAELVNGKIEYIIAVDLFNEGIDIPSLNQIIMLRNTQSSIVFTQQLGRGLRKYPGKNFVTVLDFIGNYKNNYLIPIALNQDTSRDKDRAKRETRLPSLIDVSTINFSKVASEKILASLDQVKLDGLRELRQSYQELKNKIGRTPLLFNFYQYGSVSPLVFANNHGLDNYATFLRKMGESVELSKYENQVLTFLTRELLNGKRIHELLLLDLLLKNGKVKQEDYVSRLQKRGYANKAVLGSVEDILSLSFFDVKQGKTTKKAQYGDLPIIEHSNLLDYELNEKIGAALRQNEWFKRLVVDVIKTGLKLNESYDNMHQFTLYQQYDRKDACRLLNWPKDVSAPMYGYRVGEHDTPIFITYEKSDDQKRNAIYDNTLENGRSLRWYTRVPRHLNSEEVQRLLHTGGMHIHLFVKRSDAEGKQFFYLGEAKIDPSSVKEELIGAKKKPAVGMNLIFEQPLTSEMYTYLFA